MVVLRIQLPRASRTFNTLKDPSPEQAKSEFSKLTCASRIEVLLGPTQSLVTFSQIFALYRFIMMYVINYPSSFTSTRSPRSGTPENGLSLPREP